MRHTMNRAVATAVVVLGLLAGAARAEAKDLLDYVIEAVDPTLAPARPLIECIAGGGDPLDCVKQAAVQQGKSALPIGPQDDRVKKAVAVIMAARAERWGDVVKIGGEVVAKTVACAIIPVEGPAKGTACNIIGWVIAHNADVLDKAYQALKGPDWWALVGVLGTAACDLIPADGAAGAAKDVLCGPLAGVLAGAKQFADQVAATLVKGADALENLVFGDDSHMPYNTYYGLKWQPWYQLAVDRRLQGTAMSTESIYDGCVKYFDSHNQYKSTAKKTCGDMRNKRFKPEVEAFSAALPVAVDGFFKTVVRPAVRVAVLASYGKKATGEAPGKKLWASNCAFQMRARFPFPEPNDGVCQVIAARAEKYPMFKSQFLLAAKACYQDIQKMSPDPTPWARACETVGPAYDKAFAAEGLWLVGVIGRLTKKGCKLPSADEAKTSGLLFTCVGGAAHSACLTELGTSAQKYCKLTVPVLSRADQQKGEAAAGAKAGGPKVAVPKSASARDARRGAAAGQSASQPVIPAITIEAEALLAAGKVVAGRDKASAQAMKPFGAGWSADSQVFWRAGATGETLTLVVDVAEAGSYAVEVYLTHAPDYGSLDLSIDRQRAAVHHDGYAARVTAPVAVSLGRVNLPAGEHRITLKMTGRSRSSTGNYAGIDRVRLVR
jgi:hypothetical protein